MNQFSIATRHPRRPVAAFPRASCGLLISMAASVACGAPADLTPRPLRVVLASRPSTGSPGLQSLVDHYNSTLPGISASQLPTDGSVIAVTTLNRAEGEIGIAQADVVYAAYRRGTEDAAFPHTNLSAMAVLTVNKLYVVVRRGSGYQQIEDLRGRRIAVAQRGGASELFTRVVLAAHGMSYSDVTVEFYQFNEIGRIFVEGTMDAMILVSGGSARLHTPGGAHKLRLLPIREEIVRALRTQYPFVKPLLLPPEELPSQTEQVPTVGVDNLLVCRRDLDSKFVYELTKGFFAWPEQATRYPVDTERAAATPIPLHPGAAQYYREQEILR